MNNFTEFIMSKLLKFLTIKEGFTLEYQETADKLVIRDSMGFRYEVHVKLIGRIQND